MNTKEIKELYGWNETLEKFSISTNPQLKKEFPGSFRIKKHKGKFGENQFPRNYYLPLISLGFHR